MSNEINVVDSIKAFRTGGLQFFERFDGELKISETLNKYKTKGVELGEITKILVSQLVMEPISILQAVVNARENAIDANTKVMRSDTLQAAYRALAIIGKHADEIYSQIFAEVNKNYDIDLSTIYNDTTSTFFSGKSCSLAKRGRSKDHRPDKPQIAIGLAVNAKEPVVPVVSSVAEGNMHDAMHFEEDFKKLKKHLPKGALIVFDKGVDSEKNRKMIMGEKFHFLTAVKVHEPTKEKMRKYKKHLQPILHHKNGEKILAAEWEEDGFYCTLYSDERRKASDEKKRKATIERAEKEWNELAELLKKKGAKALQRKLRRKIKKSLATRNYVIQHSVAVQQRLAPKKDVLDRLNFDADLDGMFVLVSSKKLDMKKKLKIYRKKASIEKMFSDIKSVLRLHPLRVWNDDRVKGLVLLKVLSALLLSLLQLKHKELRSIAKSTIVVMLKSLTVVVKIYRNGSKIVLGYDCRYEILAKIFSLKT